MDEWRYSDPYIARSLEEMAAVMEAHGVGETRWGTPDRLREAANAVRDLPHEGDERHHDRGVAGILARSGVAALAADPGIGDLARIVAEICTHGKAQVQSRLRASLRRHRRPLRVPLRRDAPGFVALRQRIEEGHAHP